jgi:HSP20 family molecular chaperone IbpA
MPPRKPRGPGLAGGGIARQLSERARAAAGEKATPADLGARLGAAFDSLTAMLENLGAAEAGQITRNFDLPLGPDGKSGRAVFGYTIRSGLDGLRAERFGHTPQAGPTLQKAASPPPRAPITDLFEEAGTLRIIAELPGAAPQDVNCATDGQTLTIETTAEPRYAKTLALPKPVLPASLSHNITNGILEVRLMLVAAPC